TLMLLPGHGPPTIRPRELIEEALAHRVKREAQLVAALGDGPLGVEELTARLYQGLTGNLQTLARWEVASGLERLRREGRAASSGGQWSGIRSQESGVRSQHLDGLLTPDS